MPIGLPKSVLKGERVLIDSPLQVVGYPNVFCIGDNALDIKQPSLSTAQLAIQQAECLAANLNALSKGQECIPFQFNDRGEMLSMGIGNATITGMGLTLSGSIAFQIRRIAYLSKIPTFSLGMRSAGAWLISQAKKLI